jgi:hypothetical protein
MYVYCKITKLKMHYYSQCKQSFSKFSSLRYYDVCYIVMLLITIPNLSSKYYQMLKIYTGYIDSLDILIHFPYPNSIGISSLLYAMFKQSILVVLFYRLYLALCNYYLKIVYTFLWIWCKCTTDWCSKYRDNYIHFRILLCS